MQYNAEDVDSDKENSNLANIGSSQIGNVSRIDTSYSNKLAS